MWLAQIVEDSQFREPRSVRNSRFFWENNIYCMPIYTTIPARLKTEAELAGE